MVAEIKRLPCNLLWVRISLVMGVSIRLVLVSLLWAYQLHIVKCDNSEILCWMLAWSRMLMPIANCSSFSSSFFFIENAFSFHFSFWRESWEKIFSTIYTKNVLQVARPLCGPGIDNLEWCPITCFTRSSWSVGFDNDPRIFRHSKSTDRLWLE